MDKPDGIVTAAPKRPNFTDEYRRAIVEMTLQPGASVSRIAREHGLNDNMVFKWRRRFRREPAVKTATPTLTAPSEAVALLPVNVVDMPLPATAEKSLPAATAACDVEIEVGKRRVRIRGVPLEFAERFLHDCLK